MPAWVQHPPRPADEEGPRSGMTLIQKDPENVTYTKLYFAEGETLTGAVSLAPDQSMVVPLNNAVTNAIPFRNAFDLLSNKRVPAPFALAPRWVDCPAWEPTCSVSVHPWHTLIVH